MNLDEGKAWPSLEKTRCEQGHSVIKFHIKISRHGADFPYITNFHRLLNEGHIQCISIP